MNIKPITSVLQINVLRFYEILIFQFVVRISVFGTEVTVNKNFAQKKYGSCYFSLYFWSMKADGIK